MSTYLHARLTHREASPAELYDYNAKMEQSDDPGLEGQLYRKSPTYKKHTKNQQSCRQLLTQLQNF